MTIVSIIVVVFLLLNLQPVQTFLSQRAAALLSNKLKTKVSVGGVSVDLKNHMSLDRVLILDRQNDTLVYAGSIKVTLSDWLLGNGKPVLHYLALKDTYVRLFRPAQSDTWNYTFLEDLFSSPQPAKKSSNDLEFDIKTVFLDNVHFHMDDARVGWDMNYDVGKLTLQADNLDMKRKLLDVSEITINGGNVALRSYKGGRQKATGDSSLPTEQFDPTPFNPDNWRLKVANMDLYDCRFSLNNGDNIPHVGEFDPDHIVITGIRISVKNGRITGDTIKGQVQQLTANERCGIAIRSMKSKVTVSPVASICEELSLETNYSKIRNYYAMHYRHFPDFLEYIDSVKMVGKLKDAVVDIRDIKYFAPQINYFPTITVRANGEGHGTVSDLHAKGVEVTDGLSTVSGDAAITGLPDVYKTVYNFTNAKIVTSADGIYKYVPGLRQSEDIDLEPLKFAYFSGSYCGHIDSFSVAGNLLTSMGNISANIQMQLPGFKADSSLYSGHIKAENVALGKLLRQDAVGFISLDEQVLGFSFDPQNAHINLDGTVTQLELKKYSYQNIYTKGLLAQKQFYGNLKVDDSNLHLLFDGGIDFRSNLVNVKAKAVLDRANFQKLGISDNLMTATAELDLNCTGSNIDNFSGFARLDHINIRRDNHKLALDSVIVRSSGDSTNKTMVIQSNALVAKIKGDYRLSKLPASFQYYLSRYLPDYIKAPQKTAPDQNIEFTVSTNNIDSILALTVPWIRGFDTAYLSGILNTTTKNLSLVVNVPYGTLGKFHLSNVAISCMGNLNNISMNTTIDNVAYGDSSVSGSFGMTASLGNDSLNFNLATTTPDSSSSIALNGRINAIHDSLFLSIDPSSFYLNQVKWDIAGGCSVTYADKYLDVSHLNITSALQKISVLSSQQNGDQTILVNTENIDLGQLGALAGLGYYQPDGRMTGTLKINNLLTRPYFSANISATGIKFASDTLGSVSLIGDYDISRKLAIIDPQTGIYFNDGSSVTAAGKISFDSNINQQLDGVIQFNNAPVAGSSAFLTGIFSHLKGTVSGKIAIGGKSYAPEIDGTLQVKNCAFLLDYMGTAYKIPDATVRVTNDRISLVDVTAYDQYKNTAQVTGYFAHRLFKDMYMHINVRSDKFEVMKINKADNNYFYGYAIAGMDSFTVTGPFNDIYLNAYNIFPARIYIPVPSSVDASTYSYVSFRSYGKAPEKPVKKNNVKINVNIDANMNNLAGITILLDPVSGDAIDAQGEGNIQLKMPANNDMRITGGFNIESGTYTFTFKQLLNYSKQFKLNTGSTIFFKGPFAATTLDVFATYTVKARLYDLLSSTEQATLSASGTGASNTDLVDAKQLQPVNILLHMQDQIFSPRLTFDLDLNNKSMESNPAYTKLQLINQDDRQKLDQVASLLLTNSFMSQEGLFGKNSGGTLALNNISQILSGTVSTGLTNVVNKLTGQNKLNINVNYQNYNYADAGNFLSRNQITGTVSKNFLNDRLIVEAGGKSDWAANAVAASYLSGDFKVQYLLSPSGKLRLNGFSTSDFDVTLERQIVKNGVGISWRKAFDNVHDFLGSDKKPKPAKQESEKTPINAAKDSTSLKLGHSSGLNYQTGK